MKNILLLGFYLLCLAGYSQNFTWDGPTASQNSNSVTETVSGVTATFTLNLRPTGSGNPVLQNFGGFGGSSGNVVASSSTYIARSVNVNFDAPVNILSIYVIESDGSTDGDWELSPSGGSNSSVIFPIAAFEGKDVTVNWTGVTSFTLGRIGSGDIADTYGIDTITIGSVAPTNTAPTASSFTAANGPFEDLTYTFSTSDFGYNDGDGDPLNNLLIESIPAVGALYVDVNGNDVVEGGEILFNGSTVSMTDIDNGNLQYIQSGSTNTSFQFEVNDGIENSTGNYIVTLNVKSTPTITTNSASSIGTTSVVLGGNVNADGGATVTERGVVYSTTDTTPEIGETGVTQDQNGSGTGTFSESITGLSPNTTYYFQAYATNAAGTSYGGVQSFSTLQCDASFSYGSSAYCSNDADPSPTITGLSGGTFSSSAGLSINSSTGTIDVSASTPGTYTVTYTTPSSCPNSSNVSVTINALDNASFSYDSASYDIGDSDPTPTITGLPGGTFSSTAGLSINASTGTIDVSASTLATYTVTYTTSGSCPNSSNTSIVVESLTVGPDANNVLYVDKNATGNELGDSWANALPELADALKYAKEQHNFTTANPLQIWVAGGTYKPLYSPVDNNFGNNAARENSFLMVNNVQVYGGFAGTESTLGERDLSLTANESILSGDVNGDDNGFANNAENNLHVVVSSGIVGNARLDGFTITGGNANTSAFATINGNSFSRRNGGGIYNHTSSPSFANLKVKGNTTVDNGGGIVNVNSSPTLINVILSGNTANNAGGILNQNNASPSFINVTVSGNTASFNGGGIYNANNCFPTLTNTIVWGNTGTSGAAGIYNDGSSSVNISFSLVQDIDNTGSNGLDGTDTANAPQFTDSANGDFSLMETSPAINTGSNTAYTSAGGDLQNDSDLAGNPRLYDGLAATDMIDIGAYEFQGEFVVTISPDSNNILYVNETSTGNGSGDSWANALPELADALKYAKEQDNYTTANPLQIWVAGGTYKPLYSPVDNNFGNNAARENSFLMVNNVQVYGGFAGTESTLGERDLSLTANESILSGDVNGDDNGFANNAENNLHVVVSSGNVGNASLDGFTITGGNANTTASATINGNSFSRRNGGGIYNHTSSPSFANLKVKGNTTVDNGGGIVNVNSSPAFINVILSENTANNAGGILNQNNASPSFVNVTVSGNTASINGGGILNSVNSSPTLTNTIVWGNTVTSGAAGVFNDGSSSANISFSLIQDIDNTGSNGLDGTDTANAPQFTDAANGDFSLMETSPAINTGSNTAYTNAGGDLQNNSDLAGNPRLYDGLASTDIIDMGAYEFQGEPVTDYVYENETWTPQTPFGNSTAIDNITIMNGIVDFTEEVACNNLIVNENATLNIYDVLNLNGDITSNGFGQIIFKSTATKNGELAALSADSEIQNFIAVERYVSAHRAYRMISSPLINTIFGTPITINQSWQTGALTPPSAGLDYTPGFGTHITGSITGANGFDATTTGEPSMFTLDVANQQFAAIMNTDNTTLEAAKAYLLFVRGDRSIDLTSNDSPTTETVLLSVGIMPTGDQTQNFNTLNAGDFVMFGNPYQSAVDMSEVVANSTNVNTSQFYVYDPTLGDSGAYVTVPFSGTPIPESSDADIYLQPGQGAQIASVSAGNVSVLFQESNKAPGNHTSTFRNAVNLDASISGSLYTTENYSVGKKPHDGFSLNFSNDYTNAITMEDAPKPFNFSENVGIVSNNSTFSIEQREMPMEGEEISLYSNGYKHNNYTFVLNMENLNGLTAIFKDAYTNTETVLESGENVLDFSIDEAIAASLEENRFSLYFTEENLGLKNESVFGLSIYPNPVEGNLLNIRSGKLDGETVGLKVSDVLGRTVITQQATFSGSELQLSLEGDLTSGTYFITIENGNKRETLRFIKR